ICRAHFSVLSKIPSAGTYAPYSRLGWLFPVEFRGSVTIVLPKLHEQLGPLIRISPREVSFYSIEVYDLVHKVGSKFQKDPRVYGEFVQGENPALFSITDPGEHSKRRRMMGQLYNKSKIDKLQELMQLHIARWLEAARRRPSGFDVVPACRALEADIISDFSLGTPIGALDAWMEGKELGMVSKNDEKATWMPPLLTHILWALAHNPKYQEELYHNLSKAGYPSDIASLETVPKLVACVKEGIRWAGAAAAMLPRVVPPGGIDLHGSFIPEGTVLVSSPIWYLRDPGAFPMPEYYDPYRWLTPDGSALSEDQERDRFFIPFSKGPNVCIGRHFSFYELYLSVSQTVQFCRIQRPENGTFSPNLKTTNSMERNWNVVELPARKEWVAACVTEDLNVVLKDRKD
ncbi:cytochrome P450, partial [Cryphonectria parasitica EP155]